MLEEGRSTRSFMAAQPPLARFARIGREGRSAVRVVYSQMVLVPVASVFAQPCCLWSCVSIERVLDGRERTGMGPMKKRLDVR